MATFSLSLLGAIGLAVGAPAADRTDLTFADGGFVETPPSPEADAVRAAPVIWDLAPASNGAMVGAVSDASPRRNFFGVVRYRRNGSFDRGFGREGFTRQLGLRKVQAQAVAVQKDGMIVAAGYQPRESRGSAPVLVRFRPDGSFDRSFGRGGVVAPARAYQPARLGEVLHDVAIQPGGRIIAVGAVDEHDIGESGREPAGFVVAYRPDGEVDRSFGKGGRVFFPAPGDNDEYTGLKAVQLLPGGKVLVAGFHFGSLLLARLGADGALDRTFGRGRGKITIFLGNRGLGCDSNCFSATPVAIRPDGRILVVASMFPDTPVLAQFLPNGELDQTFGRDGTVTVRHRKSPFRVFTMALQGPRIVLAGWNEVNSDGTRLAFAARRYLPSGRVDRSFGNRGAQQRRAGDYSGAFAALSQPGDRLVVAGGGEQIREDSLLTFLQLTRYVP